MSSCTSIDAWPRFGRVVVNNLPSRRWSSRRRAELSSSPEALARRPRGQKHSRLSACDEYRSPVRRRGSRRSGLACHRRTADHTVCWFWLWFHFACSVDEWQIGVISSDYPSRRPAATRKVVQTATAFRDEMGTFQSTLFRLKRGSWYATTTRGRHRLVDRVAPGIAFCFRLILPGFAKENKSLLPQPGLGTRRKNVNEGRIERGTMAWVLLSIPGCLSSYLSSI